MRRFFPKVSPLVLIVLIVVAGCSLLRTSPPEVDFDASATEGAAPLAVRFTPHVAGAATSYAWSFGDGRASDEPSPVHVYTEEGTYSVMLTVRFEHHDPVTLVKKRLVTVEMAPRKAGQVYLYWISKYGPSSSRIRRGSLDGILTQDLVSLVDTPNGLDVGGGRIYWAATTLTGGKLESSKLDGSDRRALLTGSNFFGDVAVDARHGKVYWTSLPDSPYAVPGPELGDSWGGALKRADLDGSNVEVLAEYPAESGIYADQVVVDPDGEVLVWSVVGDGYEGAIRMSSLSPFNPRDLVTGVGHPRGITLDTVPGFGANNLYYTTGDELRRVGLYWFGSKATILTGLDDPSGVAVDTINYYVYVGTHDGILRAVTDGTNLQKLPFYLAAEVGSVVLPR